MQVLLDAALILFRALVRHSFLSIAFSLQMLVAGAPILVLLLLHTRQRIVLPDEHFNIADPLLATLLFVCVSSRTLHNFIFRDLHHKILSS